MPETRRFSRCCLAPRLERRSPQKQTVRVVRPTSARHLHACKASGSIPAMQPAVLPGWNAGSGFVLSTTRILQAPSFLQEIRRFLSMQLTKPLPLLGPRPRAGNASGLRPDVEPLGLDVCGTPAAAPRGVGTGRAHGAAGPRRRSMISYRVLGWARGRHATFSCAEHKCVLYKCIW